MSETAILQTEHWTLCNCPTTFSLQINVYSTMIYNFYWKCIELLFITSSLYILGWSICTIWSILQSSLFCQCYTLDVPYTVQSDFHYLSNFWMSKIISIYVRMSQKKLTVYFRIFFNISSLLGQFLFAQIVIFAGFEILMLQKNDGWWLHLAE